MSTELCSPFVDLRQYTLFPGTMDPFVALFDREFVETQEAVGMRVIGQFRDLGDPNRFVWMRGFPDMPAREKGLTDFYIHGAAWKQHAAEARAAMIDSSDALLLRPVRLDTAFALPPAPLRPALDSSPPDGLVVATIFNRYARNDGFAAFFEECAVPRLIAAGGRILGLFETEHSPNNFPRLPLRETETVFVSFLGFSGLDAYHAHMTALGRDTSWRDDIYPALVRRLQRPPQILRLAPTSRSQLR